jgi:hypothetical protein
LALLRLYDEVWVPKLIIEHKLLGSAFLEVYRFGVTFTLSRQLALEGLEAEDTITTHQEKLFERASTGTAS